MLKVYGKAKGYYTKTGIITKLQVNSRVVFPGGSDSKESTCNAGDPGSIPWLGRAPGEGNETTHFGIRAWRIPWTEEQGGL